MKKMILVICVCALGLATASVQAVVVTHNALEIMSDSFEGVTPGSAPDPAIWNMWVGGGGNTSEMFVVDFTPPGPTDGNQYLQMDMRGTGWGGIRSSFTEITSGTVHLEFMMWLSSIGTSDTFGLAEPGGGRRVHILPDDTTNKVLGYDGSGWVDSGLTYSFDTWQKWEIDYTFDPGGFANDTYTITIDDGTPGAALLTWQRSAGLGQVEFDETVGHFYFLDAVSGAIAPKDPGDVDEDGFVGGADLTQILTNWGNSGVSWTDGDVDPYNDGVTTGDDFIGGGDYTEVLTFWGTSYPPEGTAIPEPATIGLLLIGVLPWLRRR